MTEPWHIGALRRKEKKAIIKLRDDNGAFLEAIHVPSIHYPLNDNPCEVFSYLNTQAVEDPKVLEILDRQTYKIGHCYSNTKALVKDLQDHGYNAKAYVGWLFSDSKTHPTHHCWAVLDGVHLIDLADDNSIIYYEPNRKILEAANSAEEARSLMADLVYHMQKDLPNSERIAPVGQPFPFWLYVGSECEPEEGAAIYRKYAQDHPEYEQRYHCDAEGRTSFQQMLHKRGARL